MARERNQPIHIMRNGDERAKRTEKILKYHRMGLTVRQLGERFGLQPTTISQIITDELRRLGEMEGPKRRSRNQYGQTS